MGILRHVQLTRRSTRFIDEDAQSTCSTAVTSFYSTHVDYPAECLCFLNNDRLHAWDYHFYCYSTNPAMNRKFKHL